MRLTAFAIATALPTIAPAMPFQPVEGSPSFVVVLGCLNGNQPTRTLVDTGAAPAFGVFLSPDAALHAGMRWNGAPKINNGVVGKPVTTFRASIKSFSIGPISTDTAGISSSVATAGANGRFDALVGHHFLRNASFSIDYKARDIRFGIVPASEGVPFLLPRLSPLILMRANVNNVPLTFAFDTAAESFLMSPSAARRARLDVGPPTRISGGGGFEGGRSAQAIVAMPSLTPRTLRVLVARVVDRVAAEAGTNIDGIIGPNALRLDGLGIDYPRRRIWLNPPRPQGREVSPRRCA